MFLICHRQGAPAGESPFDLLASVSAQRTRVRVSNHSSDVSTLWKHDKHHKCWNTVGEALNSFTTSRTTVGTDLYLSESTNHIKLLSFVMGL
jgi:hypothetical protein